jgi:two-component system chemotaxis response regulator CheB
MQVRKIQPNQLLISSENLVVTAEIGEDLFICAYDPSVSVGGACLLSHDTEHSQNRSEDQLRSLFRSLKLKGASRETLQLKIIGNLGRLNVERLLAPFDIKPTVTRETHTKRIIAEFNCASGALRMRPAPSSTPMPAPVVAPPRVPQKRTGPIRVLLVDDSPSVLLLLRKMIELDKGFVIVGEATTLKEAEELLAKQEPDVISLDLHLPDGNGADFVMRYMESRSTPTVLITAFAADDKKHVLAALDAGVFEVLAKPSVMEFNQYAQNLHATLRAATKSSSHIQKQIKKSNLGLFARNDVCCNSLVALGASTGGTEALFSLLTALPSSVPPILVVQHIPPVFSRTFAERLNSNCAFRVKEAEDDDEILPGKCYVAPGGKHIKIRDAGGKLRITLTVDPPVNRFRPSVDYMFNSVADLMERRSSLHVISALLTGMGDDGADGMVRLRKLGAITIAQDEATAVVFGMPKEAIERGGAKHVAGLGEMPELIMRKLINGCT